MWCFRTRSLFEMVAGVMFSGFSSCSEKACFECPSIFQCFTEAEMLPLSVPLEISGSMAVGMFSEGVMVSVEVMSLSSAISSSSSLTCPKS